MPNHQICERSHQSLYSGEGLVTKLNFEAGDIPVAMVSWTRNWAMASTSSTSRRGHRCSLLQIFLRVGHYDLVCDRRSLP